MLTTEIPFKEWKRALDEFSLVHDRWLVSLEVLSPQFGAQPQIRDVPLLAVAAELEHDGPVVVISAGRSDGEHFWHVIPGPTHIRLEQSDERADVALEIESSDGTVNILRFRTPALPETVDGVQASRMQP